MTIKQQGGIFGRNPEFNNLTVDGTLTASGGISLPADSISGDAINGGTATPENVSVSGGVTLSGETARTLLLKSTDTTVDNNQQFGVIDFESSDASSGAGGVRCRIEGKAANSGGGIGNSSLVFSVGGYSSTTLVETLRLQDGGIRIGGLSEGSLFDEYEEGNWTGTYGGNTATGSYTKIGRAVYVDITLTANSASFGSITGLPYSCGGSGYTGGFTWGRVFRMDTLDANGVPCRISVSGTQLTFTTNVATGADGVFTVTSDASGTVRAGLSGVYYV